MRWDHIKVMLLVVTMGQKLALTGDTGVKKGANHIHLAVADDLDQTAGFVTFPVAFSDYEVKNILGKWSVARLVEYS